MTVGRLALYRFMRLTRSLEERLVRLKRRGAIAGGVYRSLGQEACAVGSAAALDREAGDLVFPLIRNLGSALVAGASALDVFRQNLSRATSLTRGRDQSFHFADLSRGFVGHIAVLGDMVAVAAGCALASRLRGERRVVLVYTGDGGMSTGAFHEGLNLAAVQRLPLVVACENNGYAYSTPMRQQTAVERLSDRALAYGIPGARVDGNDVLAVHAATRAAVDRARAGEGTSLLELVTYRRLGHAEHDDQRYVPRAELEYWSARDPLERYATVLTESGLASREVLAEIDASVNAELEEAETRALAEAPVEGASALDGVYAPASPE